MIRPADVPDTASGGPQLGQWVNEDSGVCGADISLARLLRAGNTEVERIVLLVQETVDPHRRAVQRVAEAGARGWHYHFGRARARGRV